MTNPTVPNFNPTTARLATDRYDFQKHLDGYSTMRHLANVINLASTIIVNGTPTSTVQTCLEAINALVPQVIASATSGSLGLIQLSGDLNGLSTIATSPKVSGLQGRPVSNLAPSVNDVLTWNGTSWIPGSTTSSPTLSSLTVSGPTSLNSLTATNNFSLSGSGNSSLQANNLTLTTTTNTIISAASINCTLSNTFKVIANTIIFTGTSTFNNDASFNGNVILGDNTLSDNLTVNSHALFNNDVTMTSTLSLSNTLSFTGTGREIRNVLYLSGITSGTLDVRTYKYIIQPPGTLSPASYTISLVGIVDGDWFVFKNNSSFSVSLSDSGGFSATIAASTGAEYVRYSTLWRKVTT